LKNKNHDLTGKINSDLIDPYQDFDQERDPDEKFSFTIELNIKTMRKQNASAGT